MPRRELPALPVESPAFVGSKAQPRFANRLFDRLRLALDFGDALIARGLHFGASRALTEPLGETREFIHDLCGVKERASLDSSAQPLVSRRVGGTVQRHARQLVHLQTERETFVVTPEHPFATPSGWIAAGELSPGDRVISARFGVVRISKTHRESLVRPVPVFNLTVERSHAYLVGTDHVLVHNTRCGDGHEGSRDENDRERGKKRADAPDPGDGSAAPGAPPKRGRRSDPSDGPTTHERNIKELEDARSELESRQKAAPPGEDAATNQARIKELKALISVLNGRVRAGKHRAQKAAEKLNPSPPATDPSAPPKRTRKPDPRTQEQNVEALENARNELARRQQSPPPGEDAATNQARIQELKALLPVLSNRVRQGKHRAKATDAPNPSEAAEAPSQPSKPTRWSRPRVGPNLHEQNTKALEDARSELDARQKATPPGEDAAANQARIQELKALLPVLSNRVRSGKHRAKKADDPESIKPKPARTTEARKTQELEAAREVLQGFKQTKPSSAKELLDRRKRIAEIQAEVAKLRAQRRSQRYKEKLKNAPALIVPKASAKQLSREELAKQLEDAQAELRRERGGAALEPPVPGRAPKSDAERRVNELTYDLKKEDELLALKRRRADLDQVAPATDEARAKLEQDKRALDEAIQKLHSANLARHRTRKRHADPEKMERIREIGRLSKKRVYRHPDYVADTERAPDIIDEVESELADLQQFAPSPSRDELIEVASRRLEILNNLVERRRERKQLSDRRTDARKRRRKQVADGKDTAKTDRTLAELDAQLRTVRTTILIERTHELLLRDLERTEWFDDVPNDLDRARLEEIQRELAGDDLDDSRLDAYERELGESELITEDFLEDIWREAEEGHADREAILEQESQDVDDTLHMINDLLAMIPSPERTAQIQTTVSHLRDELRQERERFQVNDIALHNDYQRVQNAMARPGTTHDGRQGTAELQRIQAERTELRHQWYDQMHERLQSARAQLRILQSSAIRDPEVEADLADEIALIEGELEDPPF